MAASNPQRADAPADISDEQHEGFGAYAMHAVKHKGLKYSAVSVVNVFVGQGMLILFHSVLGWGATTSNAAAVCISAVPAFYLNRAWVWGKRGKSHFRSEVLPFWIFVVIGLVFSTLVVTVAGNYATNNMAEGIARQLVPNVANMAAFGILWVLRFFILDRLFQVAHLDQTDDGAEGDLDPGAALL
jgi:putative flippase GtrA